MADYLPAPSFNLKYDVPLTDIGAGYAAGITKMGESLGGVITGLLGGINPKTGETQLGVFGRNQYANEMIDQLSKTKDAQGNPILSEEAYKSIMGKGLAAKESIIGQYVSQIGENVKQQQAMRLEQLRERGAMARTLVTTQAQRDIAAQKTETKPEDQIIRLVPPAKKTEPNVVPTKSAEEVEAELRKRFFYNPATAGFEPLQR
jgi:hypothetical protein